MPLDTQPGWHFTTRSGTPVCQKPAGGLTKTDSIRLGVVNVIRMSMSFRLLALALLLSASISFPTSAQVAEVPGFRLQHVLTVLAESAKPGVLGITAVDLRTGTRVRVNAGRAFPMMSVIKAPVAAAVLARVDAGLIGLDQMVTIDRKDLVPGAAVPSIGALFEGGRMRFTVRRLLSATVSESDNTAVDALIKLVGGPRVVTQFLQDHGIDSMRVDLSEGDVDRIFRDTTGGRTIPDGESDLAALSRQRRGYRAFMQDPSNRTTPDAAADFLEKLWAGKLLSRESTKRLIELMEAQTLPLRLRARLPKGARLADKCGTSYTLEGQTAAFNDIGVITTPDGRAIVVAAFLTGSRADKEARDKLFAQIGTYLTDPSLLP